MAKSNAERQSDFRKRHKQVVVRLDPEGSRGAALLSKRHGITVQQIVKSLVLARVADDWDPLLELPGRGKLTLRQAAELSSLSATVRHMYGLLLRNGQLDQRRLDLTAADITPRTAVQRIANKRDATD